MEPLRKALRLPRVNLFIADDTGLGKTIEAGLIARELLLRKRAKTIVVAAPPSVLEQWKAELDERFGLLFEMLDRQYVARVRRERGFGVNPWRTHSRFLISHSLLIDPSTPTRCGSGSARCCREACSSSMKRTMLRRRAAAGTGSRRRSLAQSVISVAGLSIGCSCRPRHITGIRTASRPCLSYSIPTDSREGSRSAAANALEEVMVRRIKEDIREVQGGFPRRRSCVSRSTASRRMRRSCSLALAR